MLDKETAGRFARLTLSCIQREFPYHPAHVLHGVGDLKPPRELHPAFYGCFDWHSAVHGHWLLAHILRRFPEIAEASSIRRVFDSHLSPGNLQAEARYVQANPGFERPYGWTWLLKLAHELAGWDDTEAKRWRAHLQPLADAIETRYLEWLPKQTYPIRSGVHTNTAFGLCFAFDYAVSFQRRDLKNLIIEKSSVYYQHDRDYPAAWEPGGNDFLSPCLVEADLMRRVQPDFPGWFSKFLPKIPPSLLEPAAVTDRADGQLAHLDGLNLSRAWCFFNISRFFSKDDALLKTARRHLEAGLEHVASGSYAGEHWLASFAVYALSSAA